MTNSPVPEGTVAADFRLRRNFIHTNARF